MLKAFYIKKEFFVQTNEGTIKDHYQIQEIIGRGAFATVYKAKMKCYPYTVRAVKRIKKKFVKNPEGLFREFSVLTGLDHPQIVKVYETFQDNQNFFLVLDYCEGGELFARLEKEGNFTESDARVLFLQMLNIINYCHCRRVVHRDLKPQNFMIVSKKSLDLMLIDFGLCFKWKKNVREEIKKHEPNASPVGTAYYIAPQVFAGDYDQRCDIWSLGIILFMLTTGEPPVLGSGSQEIMAKIKNGQFNFSVMSQKDLNPSLIDLISKMLQSESSRISIGDIMKHPWLTMKLPDKKLNINFEKIKNYSRLSKFKILVLNYLASQLPQRDIMLLGQAFMSIDENKDGFLTVEELSNYIRKQDASPELGDVQQIIKHMDVDFNGKLVYNQFISACLSKSAANSRQYLRFAFQYFDLNHDGKISQEELSIILRAYKKEYSQNSQLIQQLLKECDLNNDGSIDFEEFCKYLIDANANDNI